MMNQCIVPNWDTRSQRQVEEIVEGEEGNRSSHVHTNLQNQSHLVPMSSYEIAELTWENGQPAMHGLGGLIPAPAFPTKPTWVRACDTLESMVHQATMPQHGQNPATVSSTAASSAGKWADTSGCELVNQPGLVKKRMRPGSDQCGRNLSRSVQEEYQRPEGSACASASATFCKDNDTNMMTWASFESTRSLKTKTTDDEEDSFHDGSENQDDQERETKGETGRSHSTRRSRVAAIHNQSERRRRGRINQKMKTLQKLVPNASKTDKASMLDEVIEYLKQLQAQVQFMMARSMPQMVMPPLGMQQQQQQIQMSLLARMGMGVGLGMGMGVFDFTALARAAAAAAATSSAASQSHLPQLLHSSPPVAAAAAATTFVPPPFVVPPTPDAALPNVSIPFNLNPYCTFPGQPMNMDLYNKMAVMYQQQVMNQTTQLTSNPLLSSQAKFKADDQTLHY